MDSTWALVSGLIGGLGLFLLGMGMMTDGLKLAGGYALQHILATGTSTRKRAFASGFAITALVQSSGAVAVAVIGFINAGLLDLSRSLWVIFGSNVGTTMTAWIVAVIGFKVKVEILALPAVGLGTLLYIFSGHIRRKSLGGALAGLGLLFLGLQLMQQSFSGVEQHIDLSWIRPDSIWHLLAMVLFGILLTALMQSSSASLAIVLTAVSTGMLPLMVGAAAVIGANIGSTVTALLAVLKASANARRLAGAHVVFNLIAAAIAFVLLTFFLTLVEMVREALKLDAAPAVSLALFHTVFNLVGVLAMIPLSDRLTRFLQGRFHSQEEQASRPKYLDRVTAEVPDMAIKALQLEQQRMMRKLGELLHDASQATLGSKTPEARFVVSQLISAINDFIADCSRRALAANVAQTLQQALRINTRSATMIESLRELREHEITISTLPDDLATAVIKLRELVERLANSGQELAKQDAKALTALLHDFEKQYDTGQALLIEAGSNGRIDMRKMENCSQYLSLLRRATRQYTKGLIGLLRQQTPEQAPETPPKTSREKPLGPIPEAQPEPVVEKSAEPKPPG
ncbi:Na/Pi cotransporter family protein [Marinobacterium arenosum]|uniref:Na/Pi cotransporter family protein n=1 Tax=Marinobacterium arenosum TaxID=2862496 RepID=UPI001C943D4B|nr:Na/Pi symporter [Marinobacterium arenosum]MBY4675212.1 Na/Pi symporter [Marinobacterium arenosum]